MDFQYFEVREPTILLYCPNLVSEPLLWCLMSSKFCPNVYHSYSISPFCIVLVCYLPSWIFSAVMSDVSRCVCQSPIGVYVCYFLGQLLGCAYHLFVWSNLDFMHISHWITFPTQPCLVFCANLLHSLITWMMVSSLSSHSLHLLFLLSLIYSRFDIISSYGVVLYCH